MANLPRTASEGSKPTPDKDESAAPLIRKGGKTVIPAEQDELANQPASALEGSKSSDELDGGRFVRSHPRNGQHRAWIRRCAQPTPILA